MSDLTIVSSKPNPTGKDTSRNRPLAHQLQAEWIDIQNTKPGVNLRLDGISVDHREFGPMCSNPQHAPYWVAPSGVILPAGKILRIHTGRETDQSQMAPEDWRGAHLHTWGEHGLFKLNNGACGDVLTVWLYSGGTWHKLDEASYDPYPPEGSVLIRHGDKLAHMAAMPARVW